MALITKRGIGAEEVVCTVAIIIHDKQINALIDSGACRSFIVLELVSELGLKRRVLGKGLMFQGINGGLLNQGNM